MGRRKGKSWKKGKSWRRGKTWGRGKRQTQENGSQKWETCSKQDDEFQIYHIDSSTRHGIKVTRFAGLKSAKISASQKKVWFALKVRQVRQRSARASISVFGFAEKGNRWTS